MLLKLLGMEKMSSSKFKPNLHYQTHVFCCVNERALDHPRSCCAARGSVGLRDFMKSRAKELGIKNIRINSAGCLERCELGPVMVIYPEGVWYHYTKKEDIEEILNSHILGGRWVQRLLLQPGQKFFELPERYSLELRVDAVRNETPDVLAIELGAVGNKNLPRVSAGAHIDLLINGRNRSYSIANDPQETGKYLIGVLKEKNSRGGSAWVHKNVKIGTRLVGFPPINNFPLINEAKEHVFIAGGIGITPILAMGYQVLQNGSKMTLHYLTKTPGTTPFLKEVRAVFTNNVTIYHDYGQETKRTNFKNILKRYPHGAHLYLCGPEKLMDAAISAAKAWPKKNIHCEFFVAKTTKIKPLNEEFQICLSRQQKILTVPIDKSILDVVRQAGIIADFSCQAGNCGACRTHLLNGQPQHRDAVLNEEEKKENKTIMICVSRAKSGTQLILDI